MGTGIGVYCERCGNQLDYADGFSLRKEGNEFDMCDRCAKVTAFDKARKSKSEDY